MSYVVSNLPPPLTTEENHQLLKLLQADPNDDEVRGKIIAGNVRLVIHVAKKFYNIGSIDDLVSIGTIGLIKAANNFDLDKKIKFATYATTCITNEILMYARKTKKDRVVTSLDTVLSSDMDGGELTLMDILSDDRIGEFSDSFVERDNMDDVREAIKGLPEKEQEVLKLYYSGDLTQTEVGRELGFSQSYMSRLRNKSLKKIRRMIDKKYKGDIVSVQAVGRAAKIREENKMSKDKFVGIKVNNIAEQVAVDLLEKTRQNYKEISAETGVKYSRVAELGREVRSPELRKELKAEQVRLNSQKKQSNSKKVVAHEPEMTKTPADSTSVETKDWFEPAKVPVAPIQLPFTKLDVKPNADVQSDPQEQKRASKPSDSLLKELQDDYVHIASKKREVPVAPTKGVIKRSCFVDASSKGEEVTVKDFLEELARVGNIVDPDIDASVTFEIKIKAVQK